MLEAYLGGRFSGNLPELLEPNHAERFYPAVIENSRLPADFGRTLLHCPKNCAECSYCADALERSLVQLPTIGDEI